MAGRSLGPGESCFVIAEAGVNHNGDVGLALDLVDAAADCGADAVKFQAFDAELLASASTPTAEYQAAAGYSGSQREMLKALELTGDELSSLAERATARGIIFLCTAFDQPSLEAVLSLGVPALKFGSGDLTDHGLLAAGAASGLPLILSTGMATMAEVADAVKLVRSRGTEELAVLHCVSRYPTPPADCNLRAMGSMAEALGVPVGFSDHTLGNAVALAAVALGATLLEKHITLDRDMPGPDHAASLVPAEFIEMITGIREVELALGTGVKKPVAEELPLSRVARKSLVLCTELQKGDVISAAHLIAQRPGAGISPARHSDVVGTRATRALPRGTVLSEGDFE